MPSGKSARHRAKLKHKKQKERQRKAGLMVVKKAGGRLKMRNSKELRRRRAIR